MLEEQFQQGEFSFADRPLPFKNVLGDSSLAQRYSRQDCLGRGRKGYAHGSIAYKTVTHYRKSGNVATYEQAWYQWHDQAGKHCCYLSRYQTLQVRRLLDRGATVAEILAFLAHRQQIVQLSLLDNPQRKS